MLIEIQTYIVKMNKETQSHSYTQMVTYIHSGANVVWNVMCAIQACNRQLQDFGLITSPTRAYLVTWTVSTRYEFNDSTAQELNFIRKVNYCEPQIWNRANPASFESDGLEKLVTSDGVFPKRRLQ
jgi:hypothetical protein